MTASRHGDGWRRAQRLAMLWAPAVCIAVLAAGAPPARAECKVKQISIPVRIVDRRPIATVRLNGVEMPMLVDSGAFFSVLTPSTAAELKLPLSRLPWDVQIEGYAGRIADARKTVVQSLGLPGAELSNLEFLVAGNEIGAGIRGVIGRNILAAGDTEYDLAHGMVKLSFPKGDCGDTNLAHWAGEAPVVEVDLQSTGAARDTPIQVPVRLNGTRTSAFLDTGAPRTSLTLRAARRAGLESADLTPAGRTGGAGEGTVKRWTGVVKKLEIGGEQISNIRLDVDDVEKDYGVLIGLDYFLGHRIYVSKLQRKVYITWNGGPVFVPASPTEARYDSRYAAVPAEVPADDADALARRGEAALAAGNLTGALEDLDRACELAPQDAGHFFARARVHLAQRQPAKALADLNRSLELDPAPAEVRQRRARVRAMLGDRAGARDDLARLDGMLSPAAPQRSEMAGLFANLGDTPEALRQYTLWLDTHPSDQGRASVLNERCWLRVVRALEPTRAVEDCQAAIRLDGASASYRDSLGWAWLRLGDAAQARSAFDGAIKLQDLAFSRYGRAMALRQLQDLDGSERDLAEARRLQADIDTEVGRRGLRFENGVLLPPASAPP